MKKTTKNLPWRWLIGAGATLMAAAPLAQADFTLQLLHASDLEGGVDAIEDAPNFAAIIDFLEDEEPNTVILSAGDNYLSGPFFNAAGDSSVRDELQAVYQDFYGEPDLNNIREGVGRVDIAIMNVIGFDASAIGNHEFDLGSDIFETIIEEDIRGAALGDVRHVGAQFPYLSSNLDFSGDADLSNLFTSDLLENTDFQIDLGDLTASQSLPKIAPSTYIMVGGEKIGVVGATTPLVETISSPGASVIGPDSNDMAALAAVIQPQVDALVGDGINKIILVTHLQQIALEQELIGLLNDVDIVIAGGSDTLLADSQDTLRPGDVAAGDYPFETTNADGDPAVIVSTDGEYSYVGRLVVDFDDSGVLLPGTIDENISGAFATTDAGVMALWGNLTDPFLAGTTGNRVGILTEAVLDVVIDKDSDIFGLTDVFIEGRREFVRTEETNMGNLTADANLAAAQAVDSSTLVSIKNGGGIRAEIGVVDGYTGELLPVQANPLSGKQDGEISLLDIENTLRFNNLLSLVTLTADGLLEVIEHAVAATAPGATPGQFPQIGGLAFSFDPDAAAGERVISAAIKDANGNTLDIIAEDGEVVGDPDREIRVVTLNFMADGGDSYPFPDLATDRVDTGIGEQDALAEFLADNFSASPFEDADLPASQDARIQDLALRSDSVAFPPMVDDGAPLLTPIGTYETGLFDESAAEITAYDPGSERLFLVNANDGSVDILNLSDPTDPTLVTQIDIQDLFGSDTINAEPNSVDVYNGLVAVAVARERDADGMPLTGFAAFFNTDGDLLTSTEVGYLPDMITFTPNGRYVLTANEGEPNDNYTFDPVGSVSSINVNFLQRRLELVERRPSLAGRIRYRAPQANTSDFSMFERRFFARRFDLEDVRVFGPGASLSEDLEPEYITVDAKSRVAYVTCQENNAIVAINVASARPLGIFPLGFKDMSVDGFDASDRDDAINITNWPVFGMYQPDAIATFTRGRTTYLITANEGDARDYDGFSEEERVKDLVLDPTAFPDADTLQENEALGRLTVTTTLGDTDNDGDYDELYAFGARSFSIWRVGRRNELTLVYDSGAEFEQIIASLNPEFFNSSNDESEFDSRSDAKGPEPEGVTVGTVGSRTYAFIGLERIGGIMVYDITNPFAPEFIQYMNNRNFLADPESSEAGDLGPEGLEFVPAGDSPNGKSLLIVANEVSGTVTVYTFE